MMDRDAGALVDAHYDEIVEEMKQVNRRALEDGSNITLTLGITEDGELEVNPDMTSDRTDIAVSLYFEFNHYHGEHGHNWADNEDVVTDWDKVDVAMCEHADEETVAEFEKWYEGSFRVTNGEIANWWKEHYPDIYEQTKNEYLDWACNEYTDYEALVLCQDLAQNKMRNFSL